MTDEPLELAILRRILQPGKPFPNRSAAKSFLTLSFSDEDNTRVGQLAERARAGQLTEAERHEIDVYGRIGSLISILKSKAHLTLNTGVKRRPKTSGRR